MLCSEVVNTRSSSSDDVTAREISLRMAQVFAALLRVLIQACPFQRRADLAADRRQQIKRIRACACEARHDQRAQHAIAADQWHACRVILKDRLPGLSHLLCQQNVGLRYLSDSALHGDELLSARRAQSD